MKSSPRARTICVSVNPGWITAERTPWYIASLLRVAAAPSSAALVAA